MAMASTTITVPALRERPQSVRHFFGTRHGPLLSREASPPQLQGLELPDRVSIISVKQVHGTAILVIDRPGRASAADAGAESGWDALVTSEVHVLLTIRTADCVPVLLYDPVERVVAAIHAGWRGTVAGIVPLTLARMADQFGSHAARIRAGIGPSIGPCCYEVDAPVLDRLRVGTNDFGRVVQEKVDGKGMLDLGGLVRSQLQNVGVRPDHIDRVELCTACQADLFYSYRRERTVVGTMVSGIMLTAPVAV